MENISPLTERERIELPAFPYLADHRFLGNAVLPAVESMELLASAVGKKHPGIPCTSLYEIDLRRFIPLAGDDITETVILSEHREDGSIKTTLATVVKPKKGTLTRTRDHVIAEFRYDAGIPPAPPVDVASCLDGVAAAIDAESLYGELVPFGPAYRNAKKTFLADEGAIAFVYGGDHRQDGKILGSPFVLDAAFHAACAWGQRMFGYVGFPVFMKRRAVIVPALAGTEYFARIIPAGADARSFTVDIFIYAMDGTLHEAATGLVMKDISGGKLSVPQWITGTRGPDPLEHLRARCDGMTAIELDAVAPFADRSFSQRETGRLQKMGPRRIRTFTGSRLACKRLTRILSGSDMSVPPGDIETVIEGSDRPAVAAAGYLCSVSHDGRFAVAAAARSRLGIDVEMKADRLAATERFYVHESEKILAERSDLGVTGGLLRIWSIKEAAAKALNAPLSEAWKRVRVLDIGDRASRISVDGTETAAYHGGVGEHLFTLITLQGYNP